MRKRKNVAHSQAGLSATLSAVYVERLLSSDMCRSPMGEEGNQLLRNAKVMMLMIEDSKASPEDARDR